MFLKLYFNIFGIKIVLFLIFFAAIFLQFTILVAIGKCVGSMAHFLITIKPQEHKYLKEINIKWVISTLC